MRHKNRKYSKAVVTGGAGFIGSHLCQKLVNLEMEVVVVDDLSKGSADALPENVRLSACSVTEREAVCRLLDGVDIVFHLAARTSIQGYGSELYEGCLTNVLGTVSLLSCFEEQSVKKIVFTSSAAVYGEGVPGRKNSEALLPAPISPYGISKLSSEQFICDICGKLGIDFQILRLFNVFGPGQRSGAYAGVINEFIKEVIRGKPPQVWGDGEQARDFVHVDDVVNAFVLAMNSEIAGQVINIGTSFPTSINQLARLVLAEMGSSLNPEHVKGSEGEIMYSVADITKAENVLGYEIRNNIEDGIGSVVSWLSKGTG